MWVATAFECSHHYSQKIYQIRKLAFANPANARLRGTKERKCGYEGGGCERRSGDHRLRGRSLPGLWRLRCRGSEEEEEGPLGLKEEEASIRKERRSEGGG